MTNPEPCKIIGASLNRAWTAIGPLIGVLIGAWLTSSSDRKKWERENRKEECRELTSAISHAVTLAINVGNGTSQQEAYNAYLESVKTFHDRIFIADDLEKRSALDKWADGVHDFGARKIDARAFSDQVESIRKIIVDMVIRAK